MNNSSSAMSNQQTAGEQAILRAKLAHKAATAGAHMPSENRRQRMDVDGFVRALHQDHEQAIKLVACESQRADRKSFESAQEVLAYLIDQSSLVSQTRLLEKRVILDAVAIGQNGRRVKMRMPASLPTALMMCGMEALKGGISTQEHAAFCEQVGSLMKKVDVAQKASILALEDIIKVAGDRLDLSYAATALASVGLQVHHATGIYSARGERVETGPASKALDVISGAVMMAHFEGRESIQKSLAMATATVVESGAYAAEYLDPTPILKGASSEIASRAKQGAQENAICDFPFTLTNMMVHYGIPGDANFKQHFPSDSLATVCLAGHNGETPVPGFRGHSTPQDTQQGSAETLPSSFRFASGDTVAEIIGRTAERMRSAPLDSNGEFKASEFRRLKSLMEMRVQSGDMAYLRLFEPVITALAERSQCILLDAAPTRPDIIRYLVDHGHGSINPLQSQGWRRSAAQSLMESITRTRDLADSMADSAKCLIAAGADASRTLSMNVRCQDLQLYVKDGADQMPLGKQSFMPVTFTLSDRIDAMAQPINQSWQEVRQLIDAAQAKQMLDANSDSLRKPKLPPSA